MTALYMCVVYWSNFFSEISLANEDRRPDVSHNNQSDQPERTPLQHMPLHRLGTEGCTDCASRVHDQHFRLLLEPLCDCNVVISPDNRVFSLA